MGYEPVFLETFLSEAFFVITASGVVSGRWTIRQAHITAGIHAINDACIAKAANPPIGLSSAKIMAHGKIIAMNERNL
jgi:hypothetical protein